MATIQWFERVRIMPRRHGPGLVLTAGDGQTRLTAAIYRTTEEAMGARKAYIRGVKQRRQPAPEGTTA